MREQPKKIGNPIKKMILKDGFIQPERLSLVTLDRPTHCPMGSRRGDPAANAAPLKIQKRRNQGKDGCINLANVLYCI